MKKEKKTVPCIVTLSDETREKFGSIDGAITNMFIKMYMEGVRPPRQPEETV